MKEWIGPVLNVQLIVGKKNFLKVKEVDQI